MADTMGECLLSHETNAARKAATDRRRKEESWDSISATEKVGNDTEVPKSVGSILDKWVKQMGNRTITDEERRKLTAAVIVNGEKPPSVLYRGVSIEGRSAKQVMNDFKVGKPVDMSPSSFSEELESAAPYADNGDVAVMFKLSQHKGVKALNVQDRAMEREGFNEQEWITVGRFYVRGVKLDDEGRIEVWLSNVLF